jgi:hypothetical protein
MVYLSYLVYLSFPFKVLWSQNNIHVCGNIFKVYHKIIKDYHLSYTTAVISIETLELGKGLPTVSKG